MKNENAIINALNESDKDILVVGTRGTGKSTMINDLLQNDNDKVVIDGTLEYTESLFLKETGIYNLYQTCLIIKKIISDIKKGYEEKYIKEFIFYEMYVDRIIKQIYFMGMTDIYRKETDIINEELLNMPEILLDRLLNLMSKKLDLKDITLVIDNFDVVEGSSQSYQKFIYNRIKSYLRLILTVSDKSVVNNDLVLKEFSKDNEIVKMDYSQDVNSVRDILDNEVRNTFIRKQYYSMRYNLNFVLSNETIELMIKKTNGNLFDMLTAIRYLYYHIKTLDASEYNSYIIDFIDNEINKSPIFTGVVIPERKLYINPKESKGMF